MLQTTPWGWLKNVCNKKENILWCILYQRKCSLSLLPFWLSQFLELHDARLARFTPWLKSKISRVVWIYILKTAPSGCLKNVCNKGEHACGVFYISTSVVYPVAFLAFTIFRESLYKPMFWIVIERNKQNIQCCLVIFGFALPSIASDTVASDIPILGPNHYPLWGLPGRDFNVAIYLLFCTIYCTYTIPFVWFKLKGSVCSYSCRFTYNLYIKYGRSRCSSCWITTYSTYYRYFYWQ